MSILSHMYNHLEQCSVSIQHFFFCPFVSWKHLSSFSLFLRHTDKNFFHESVLCIYLFIYISTSNIQQIVTYKSPNALLVLIKEEFLAALMVCNVVSFPHTHWWSSWRVWATLTRPCNGRLTGPINPQSHILI